MPLRAQSWKHRFTVAADTACLLLLGLALLIEYAGGLRFHIGRVWVTSSSGTRALLLAVIVLLVRHVVVMRPSIVDRTVHALSGLRTLSMSGGRRLAYLASTWRRPFGRRPARASSLTFDWPSTREWLWVTLVIAVVTAVILRQQVLAFTSVPDFGDPLFSMWRLSWVAHQLPRAPAHLFDGNIYHPATRTLAYSDAMLAPALLAAPALWLGAPVLVVYTTLVLAACVAAGVAMFALARAVTEQAGAAMVAALIFAFDPFRVSHYSHLELQFTCWMPLALLALFRALSTARTRDGVAIGIFVSLQALSSLYYGAYLSVSLAVVVAGWIWCVGWPTRRAWGSLGLAVLIGGVTAALITIPYRANRSTVGERGEGEIRAYSATYRHYLTSSRRSVAYGTALYQRQGNELELFPGTVPVVIGAAAFIPPVGPLVLPTALGLVASVEASFGLNGTLYTWLNKLPPFRAFRVAARFRAVAGLFLALLAGMGVARIVRTMGSVWLKRATVSAIAIAVLADLRPSLELRPLWTHAPDIYAKAPTQAVLADLPMYGDGDPFYVYLSTFHWHPIANGASGFEPVWYAPLVAISRKFPADEALDAFNTLGTKYFVLHEAYYRSSFSRVAAEADAQPRLQFVATSTWEEGECRLYRLVR
jgi:hypothetical protein